MEKKNETKPEKKGIWNIVKESVNKANSGCGPGCGCNVEKKDSGKKEEKKKER